MSTYIIQRLPNKQLFNITCDGTPQAEGVTLKSALEAVRTWMTPQDIVITRYAKTQFTYTYEEFCLVKQP